MKKIPTLFKRDPENMRRVLPEVTPGCGWVLAGEGVATRKYDGTCCMFDGTSWWARRAVKPGKQPPENFQAVETDETTGKTVGWEPIEQSGFAKWHEQARALGCREWSNFQPATYELVGPKINGNPEGLLSHRLIPHVTADRVVLTQRGADMTIYDWLADFVASYPGEGIVWHHPDGRMAKLKRRDFA